MWGSGAARRAVVLAGLGMGLASAACGGGGGGGGGGREAAPAPRADPVSSASGSTIFASVFAGGGGAEGRAAFETYVHPLLRSYCTSCHVGSGPGFPHLAHPDPETAFRAVVDNQKVNLAVPDSSRLVQRLSADSHHCWSASCAADGSQMQSAIEQWAALVLAASGGGAPSGDPNPSLAAGWVSSDARSFAQAQPVESTRDDRDAIALWRFQSGAGARALDTSGVAPTMDLELSSEGVEWLSGGGLSFDGGWAIATEADSRKLYNLIASGSGSQQYTVEAWIVPASIDQEGPARIVSYSNGNALRNFMMGQINYNYVFRNRSLAAGIDGNGEPALMTPDAEEDLQAELQHAVLTYDQTRGRRIYVNGAWTEDPDPALPGLLVGWHPDHRLIIGNETSRTRPWRGQMRLVAIYSRALSEERIRQNYRAGSSRQFALRFGLDNWLPGASLSFQVSEFDAYSYLFCFPTLSAPTPSGFAVESLRIAVNGTAPVASQSFRSIQTVVDEPAERLSDLCSVVPKDLGVDRDRFEVLFDVLDANVNRFADAAPTPTPPELPAVLRPDSGIRDFAEINDSMSELTGVPATLSTVQTSFLELEQQLPGSNDLRSFVSSQQVAISRLALEYCDVLVETPTLRTAFFGGSFPFGSPAELAFADPANRDVIYTALADRMVGTGLASQPSPAELQGVLDPLVDALVAPCAATPCDAERTEVMVKAACAAVLASAAVQLH